MMFYYLPPLRNISVSMLNIVMLLCLFMGISSDASTGNSTLGESVTYMGLFLLIPRILPLYDNIDLIYTTQLTRATKVLICFASYFGGIVYLEITTSSRFLGC